jgi:ATP-binding protein involved in chromosome partitioning
MADPVSASQVLDALRPIIDPDFQKSIVDLGFIKDLRIDRDSVSFAIELTTPACPVKDEFKRAAHERVLALEGVDNVAVTMTANTRQATRQGGAGDEHVNLPGVKNIIAIASGKGGVGKSTTAINLALTLRDQGAEVGILDADVYGPSLALLTGAKGRPDTTPDRKIIPLIGQGMKLMSMAFFMNDDTPVIWRGPMVHGLIKQFLTDVQWGELDYLIVDMPPGTGDAALTLTQMAPLSGAVIVTTANDLSLIDARKGLQMFEKVGVPILGIVENMSYFTPSDQPDRKYHIFGRGGGERVSKELNVAFLGEVPIDPRIAEDGDLGKPIVTSQPDSPSSVAFKRIAGEVVRKVAMLAVQSPPVADANITWVQ